MTHMTHDTSTRAMQIVDNVRAIGPTLRERALENERAGRHSDATIADLSAAGVFNIGSPAEFGPTSSVSRFR